MVGGDRDTGVREMGPGGLGGDDGGDYIYAA
jgi:hypothetical protein